MLPSWFQSMCLATISGTPLPCFSCRCKNAGTVDDLVPSMNPGWSVPLALGVGEHMVVQNEVHCSYSVWTIGLHPRGLQSLHRLLLMEPASHVKQMAMTIGHANRKCSICHWMNQLEVTDLLLGVLIQLAQQIHLDVPHENPRWTFFQDNRRLYCKSLCPVILETWRYV